MEGLGTTLRRLLEALDGGVQAHYDRLGVNFRPRFYPVARLLSTEGKLSIRALATAIGVSHSAVSQTVTQMRSAKLVSSGPGVDGRERLVELTTEGRKVCKQLQGLWSAVEGAAVSLDAELPSPLHATLLEAANLLEVQDFEARITAQLKEGVAT
jgi:DNA-binding MarR family transcriptional regulator